jgi:hypothetical protein
MRSDTYLAEIDLAEDTHCDCESCGWSGTAAELADIEAAGLDPGDPSPAGRCPNCDALAHPALPADRLRDAAPELLAALRRIEERVGAAGDVAAIARPLLARFDTGVAPETQPESHAPRIAVILEGGWVQSVVAEGLPGDTPYVVIDYDADDSDADEASYVEQTNGAPPARCIAFVSSVTVEDCYRFFSALAAPEALPEPEWSTADQHQASREGWAIFNDCEIQCDDEAEAFESDEAAIRWIRFRAEAGSDLHQRALRIHDAHSVTPDAAPES